LIQFGFHKKKKINQSKFFFKKTEIEQKPVQIDRFRFGFLGQKPVQTGLSWFFLVLLDFFSLTRFFSLFFGLGSVQFFRFQTYKTETEPVGFF
jgi:hypothetical protein